MNYPVLHQMQVGLAYLNYAVTHYVGSGVNPQDNFVTLRHFMQFNPKNAGLKAEISDRIKGFD